MAKKADKMVGFQIKSINNLIRRKLDVRFHEAGLQEVTGIQGPVIGYIYQHSKERDIFQKDIEKEFSIQRSTATVLLQNLEQKGLIVREAVDYDARLKKLLVTPRAVQLHCLIIELIDGFHEQLEDGISPQEKNEFLRILDKLKDNLNRL